VLGSETVKIEPRHERARLTDLRLLALGDCG